MAHFHLYCSHINNKFHQQLLENGKIDQKSLELAIFMRLPLIEMKNRFWRSFWAELLPKLFLGWNIQNNVRNGIIQLICTCAVLKLIGLKNQ